MTPEVIISYNIPNAEWHRTAALRWDEETFPLYHCFFGLVGLTVQGSHVLDEGRFDMSVADLAVGLSELLEKLRSDWQGALQFQQSDDSLQLYFALGQERVMITHNLAPGKQWECRKMALIFGIERFARSFASEVSGRVPQAFEWRDMKILEQFAQPPTPPGQRE